MSTEVAADARRTDTRDRILDVSAELFVERGYAGTSIRDIAEQLGVTKAALYYHFSSKAEILQALVAEPIQRIRGVLEQGHDLSTAPARASFVKNVIEAMAQCSTKQLAVFKDPELQGQVDVEVAQTGITNVLALTLAMGLSGVTDPAKVAEDDVLRAAAAVSAGEAMLAVHNRLHPEVEKLAPADIDRMVSVIVATLES